MSIPKFKRVLRMGSKGPDVRAVKIGLKRVHKGAGLDRSRHFGRNLYGDLRVFQHSVGLHPDGVYGEKTHEKLAPHFTPFARWLYKRTKVPVTDVTRLNRVQAALRLLHYHAEGRYHDDSGGDLSQIAATADGHAVRNQIGQYVYLDSRMLQSLCFLIEKGYKIGTFAMCSDHPYESALGHGGGHAVDISSINGVSIASGGSEQLTYDVAKLLHSGMPKGLTPWQLICDGCGYQHVPAISDLTIPGAWYYGSLTMSEHRNHIHNGQY